MQSNSKIDALIDGNGEGSAVFPQASAQAGTSGDKPLIDPSAAVLPEHEVELQQDVLEVMGARLEPDKKYSAAVHKDVALRWAEIFRNGLPAEEVSSKFWTNTRLRKTVLLFPFQN